MAASVLTSGALRAALLAAYPDRQSLLPPSNVLLYGTFFAIMLAIVAIPPFASWQRAARQAVERAYPIRKSDISSQAWSEERGRVVALLGLFVGGGHVSCSGFRCRSMRLSRSFRSVVVKFH